MAGGAGTMRGKTVLLTGATAGIGHATAVELARRGADLVIACRNRERGEATAAAARAAGAGEGIEILQGDLAKLADVRRLAREFLASGRPLHVLINNAGVVNLDHRLTVDGIEEVFAVNHLAPFLLTNLLLERLQASAPARVVTVASDAHKFVGGINFDDLGFATGYGWTKSYGQSKLANILFSYELARRLQGTRVTSNSLHPGAVSTGLGTNNGRWARGLIALLRPFFKTPERGAETSLYLATAAEVEEVSGKYFSNCREVRSSRASMDTAAGQRLWNVSAAMTGLDI
jgi:NAD(P)-dependent dehydrogenase (short-subunit alcohol dehydrogenase family)